MPVITLYIPPEGGRTPCSDAIHQLQKDCHCLCLQRLQAAPEKVQIQVVRTCLMPLGCPLYADVKYRHQTHRDDQLMALFMEELECIIARHCHTGAPRIRCFPVSGEQLYARN